MWKWCEVDSTMFLHFFQSKCSIPAKRSISRWPNLQIKNISVLKKNLITTVCAYQVENVDHSEGVKLNFRNLIRFHLLCLSLWRDLWEAPHNMDIISQCLNKMLNIIDTWKTAGSGSKHPNEYNRRADKL